jgi:hypothetical protein
MAINTKKRHHEIYSAAVDVINAAGGVEVIDNLPQHDRLSLLRQLAQQVREETVCHADTAKRNLAKAMRRARYDVMVKQWGGKRPGSGRPKKQN